MKKINIRISLCLAVLFLYSCNSTRKEHPLNMEEQLLEKVAVTYIQKLSDMIGENNNNFTFKTNSLIIKICGEIDYNGKKTYSVFHTFSNIDPNKLPTLLIKRDGFYIAMYIQNRPPMNIKEIPKSVLRTSKRCGLHEQFWTVLICPDTYEYIVVHSIESKPYDCIKQLREFECNGTFFDINQDVRVEKEIIDQEVLPPLPSCR